MSSTYAGNRFINSDPQLKNRAHSNDQSRFQFIKAKSQPNFPTLGVGASTGSEAAAMLSQSGSPPQKRTMLTSSSPGARRRPPTSSKLMGEYRNSSPVAQASHDVLAKQFLRQEFPKCPIIPWRCSDPTGLVHGQPGCIEINILKRGRDDYICGMRPRYDSKEVKALLSIGKIYRHKHPGNKLACILVTKDITPSASSMCSKCKIKVYIIGQ